MFPIDASFDNILWSFGDIPHFQTDPNVWFSKLFAAVCSKRTVLSNSEQGRKRAYTIEFEGENRIQRVSQSPTYQGIELGIRLAGT